MKLSVFYDHIINAAKQNNISVEDVLNKIKEYGIDYVEIDSYFLENDYNNVMMQLNRAGISISCVYKTFDFTHGNDYDKACEFVRLSKSAGSRAILLIPGFEEPDNMEVAFEKSIPVVRRVCDYAVSQNIIPTMEDYDDCKSPCATWEGLRRYVNEVDNLGIAFDTGNFLYSGEEAMEAYSKLSDRIVHVHLKDRVLLDNGSDCCVAKTGLRMFSGAVGDGCIPMKEIFCALKSINYDGILAIEHFGATNHLESIIKSIEFIRENYGN